MPNPYDDILGNDGEKEKTPRPEFKPMEFDDDHFQTDGKEPLDEILESIKIFQEKADSFSQLLSKSRAIDHKVDGSIFSYFIISQDKHDQEHLVGEKKYHDLLKSKFEKIIVPMRELAELHLQTVKQFNQDIDKNYFSIEKTDHVIKSEKLMAVDGINLQRKILADASSDLDILKDALDDTERRIKKYINAGGVHNISSAESVMIEQKRAALTSGRTHQFNYSFFNLNLLDKTVIAFNVHMKETSSQYLGKLMKAFEIR